MRTGLKSFYQKYRRIYVIIFNDVAPSERNLEIFTATVKLFVFFYLIIVSSYFTHNPILLASWDCFQIDMIEKRLNASKTYLNNIVSWCYCSFPCSFSQKTVFSWHTPHMISTEQIDWIYRQIDDVVRGILSCIRQWNH